MRKEIGYRILVLYPELVYDYKQRKNVQGTHPHHWFGKSSSYGGYLGVYDSVEDAKNSARANSIKKEEYQIWKMHIDIPSQDSPWFPPEQVV